MAFSPETYALLKAQGGGGGGSDLPSVTDADNGKVLSVVNGAWAADARGKVVYDDGTINKSFNDLLAMFNQGIIPWLVWYYADGAEEYGCYYLTCQFVFREDSNYVAVFSCIGTGNDNWSIGFLANNPDSQMIFD